MIYVLAKFLMVDFITWKEYLNDLLPQFYINVLLLSHVVHLNTVYIIVISIDITHNMKLYDLSQFMVRIGNRVSGCTLWLVIAVTGYGLQSVTSDYCHRVSGCNLWLVITVTGFGLQSVTSDYCHRVSGRNLWLVITVTEFRVAICD